MNTGIQAYCEDECALSHKTGKTVDARLILVRVGLVQVQFEPTGENYSFTRTTSLPPNPHFLPIFFNHKNTCALKSLQKNYCEKSFEA